MRFLNNKYTRIYFKIIHTRQKMSRYINDNNLYEAHHILPKSMGGSNKKKNLVLLTYREHFLVHLILLKMTQGEDTYKMTRAFVRMCKYININSHKYSYIKTLLYKNMTGDKNPAARRMWVHNPNNKIQKFIHIDEFSDYSKNGYITGMIKQIGGYSKGSKIWITNGKYNKMINKNEPIPQKWRRGKFNKLNKETYKKAAKHRHTKEKDLEHSKKMKGRKDVINLQTGEIKRVDPIDIEKFLKNGYILKKKEIQKLPKCEINKIKYKSISEAARQLKLNRGTIYKRIVSNKCKWDSWIMLKKFK